MTKQKQMLKRARHTKIVATLGPASSDEVMIRALFEAGADVFRLNFSHGSHEDHAARHKMIRKIEAELCRPVGIMADLQGPKLRLGKFHNGGIDVVKGHRIHLDSDPSLGDPYRVQLPHPEILKALQVGDPLLVDDGKVRMVIVEKNGDDKVTAEVECGSRLMDRKGVNMPGTIIDVSVLTEKDRKDMEFALGLGVEWIALSFVQRPEDIIEARKLVGERAQILAKIEKPSAVDSIAEIIELCDAVMLARGDLGVECPPEQVPVIQKRVIRAARAAGKPLIIATQMLESMTVSPTPTRAEASDVATAVFDGADAVMLSAETASGNYPVEAVQIMDRIAQTVESDTLYREIMNIPHNVADNTKSTAITAAAYDVARHVAAKLIVNFSSSGATALRMVRERPKAPLLCLTCNLHVARRLSLSYGANPLVVAKMDRFEEMVKLAGEAALHQGFVAKGDVIVITAGDIGLPGKTNTLRVVEV
jgi:pyruvate kinase